MSEKNTEKWIFILNPTAGNNFALTLIPEIERRIREFNIEGEILLTERPGHASALSESAYKDGIKYIIAVGGDGTFNEVARPLVGRSDVVTGSIPAGTGNDFNRIPGFHDRFDEDDWKTFFGKNVIAQDVGKVNTMVFLNGMGLGFDAEVAAQNYTEGGTVKKGGGDKYIWHILKTLLLFREKKMIVSTADRQHETDCFINTVSIGRRFAGSFFLTPEAIANDGLLDVCSIKRLNLFHRFRLLLKVPKGAHISDKRVNYYKVSSIDLEFPSEVPFHFDGEISRARTFNISILPGALNIIYNPHGNHYFRKV